MSEPCLKTESFSNPVAYAAQIIIEHENFIRWVIKSQNTTNEPVDDLFQDFYIQLIAMPVPHDVRDVKGYLYKAIINHLTNSYRRVRIHKEVIRKIREDNNIETSKTDPAKVLLIRDEINQLFDFIKETSSRQRYMAINLRYREGCSIQEVAERMGIKYSSVRKYISFGLGKVRKCLNDT